MYNYFHPQEEFQVWKIMNYIHSHKNCVLDITFADEERYLATFHSAYESENSGEMGVNMDDPHYDEFFEISFDILSVIRAGSRRYRECISLDYRDFPVLVKDAATGETVYSAETDPTRQ